MLNRFALRWWIYQRERFPVLAHAPLIAAFSFSAVCYSSLLRGRAALPPLSSAAVAFVTSFLFFLQLRISDEFKDNREDSLYRPYRPVPRGLVSLKELGVIGLAGAILQITFALLLEPLLAVSLICLWLYLGLMSKEFFARRWLRARPITYICAHMLIVPMIDFYAASCEWLVVDGAQPAGLFWFLAVSFFNGLVIEIGRKIRAPRDEEFGVETYTFLWGRERAVIAWVGAMVMTALCALMAAHRINFIAPVLLLLAALLIAAAIIGYRFLNHPVIGRAKWFETISGVWTLLMYLSLGAVPLLLRAQGGINQ